MARLKVLFVHDGYWGHQQTQGLEDRLRQHIEMMEVPSGQNYESVVREGEGVESKLSEGFDVVFFLGTQQWMEADKTKKSFPETRIFLIGDDDHLNKDVIRIPVGLTEDKSVIERLMFL